MDFDELKIYCRKLVVGLIFYVKYVLYSIPVSTAILKWMKDIRYDAGFNETSIDIPSTRYADPLEIEYKRDIGKTHAYNYKYFGQIYTGCTELADPVEQYEVYQSIEQRIRESKGWSETPYYKSAMNHLDSDKKGYWKFTTEGEVESYFSKLDKLYEDISQHGYKENPDAKNQSDLRARLMKPIWEHDEVAIDVGSDGKLYHINGRHRLAIARVTEVDRIPVRIIRRHQDWCQFRKRVIKFVKEGEGKQSKYPIQHPDLQDVTHMYEPEDLCEKVISHLDKPLKDVNFVECNPGVSQELLLRINQHGGRAYACGSSATELEFINWYCRRKDGDIEAYREPTDIVTALSSCVILATEPVEHNEVLTIAEEVDQATIITTDAERYYSEKPDNTTVVEIDAT